MLPRNFYPTTTSRAKKNGGGRGIRISILDRRPSSIEVGKKNNSDDAINLHRFDTFFFLFENWWKKSSKLEEVKKLIKNFEQTCFRMLLESNESFAIIQVQLYSSKLDRFNESSLRATRGHAPFRPPSMNARMLLSPSLCRPYSSSQARRYLLIERELEGGKRSRGAKNRSLKRRGAL